MPLACILGAVCGSWAAPLRAVAVRSCAVYDSPAAGLLPQRFLQAGDTCSVDSVLTDSAGEVWYRLPNSRAPAWVTGATTLRYVGEHDTSATGAGVRTRDEDRRRRYRLVRENPHWPRRIVEAVREGTICLDMTEDQVRASWGQPFQSGTSFMLGIGEYTTWFYRGAGDTIVFVNLAKGKVIGWYQKGR